MSEPIAVGVLDTVDEERRLVFGWAYVTHDRDGHIVIDKSGDSVEDPAEIEAAAYDFVLDSRRGGVDHLPGVTVSTLVESMAFTPDKVAKLGLPAGLLPTGWWVGFYIEDDAVWDSVKKGERLAFSVHGSGVRTPVADTADSNVTEES